MKRTWAIVVACVVILAAAAAFLVLRQGDEFPYTADEMTTADIECDAEQLAAALPGASAGDVRDTVEDGLAGSHVACLRDKLPDLDDDQLARLNTIIEQQRDRELDEALG